MLDPSNFRKCIKLNAQGVGGEEKRIFITVKRTVMNRDPNYVPDKNADIILP